MRVQNGPFTTAPGPRRRLLCWEIWAEDGMVMMFDKEMGEVHALTVPTAEGRLRVFTTELEVLDLGRTAEVNPSRKAMLNDQFRHRKMLVDYTAQTIQEAKEQGNQTDPVVAEKKLRTFHRSRGPTGEHASVDDLINAVFGHKKYTKGHSATPR